MSDSNKHICRLCLEITPAYECETIVEVNKETLNVLRINMNFDINDHAVACNRCLKTLRDCIDFKSHITTLEDVDPKLIHHNEVLCLENSHVCRLCKSLIEEKAFNCTTDLRDMIKHCLPELDFNTIHEPVICKRCLSCTKKYYAFMKTCHQVEQKIENYYQVRAGHGTMVRVILDDVLKFESSGTLGKPIVIKMECSDDDDDINAMKHSKSEHTVNIKSEEVDIKDELDNRVATNESDESGNCNSSGKSPLNRNASKGNGKHKCALCPFGTEDVLSMHDHMTCHKGPTKAFGCQECSFETDYKYNLVQHFLKHKDKSKVKTHKCPLCPLKSKYKSAVVLHQKVMHNTNIKMYNCKKCSFSTKHKVSFEGHQLMHKNPEEVLKHKCDKCGYQSKYKTNLVRHMVTHEDPNVASKYKCDKCHYSSRWHINLRRHVASHSH